MKLKILGYMGEKKKKNENQSKEQKLKTKIIRIIEVPKTIFIYLLH